MGRVESRAWLLGCRDGVFLNKCTGARNSEPVLSRSPDIMAMIEADEDEGLSRSGQARAEGEN